MNRIILAVAIISCSFGTSLAQSSLKKIPANASMVMKYAGENFSKNLPLQKIESYNFVKDHLFKALQIDSLTSLQNIGINFQEDTYQYITMEDTCMSFVSLFKLNDKAKFLKLLDANYHAEMKPESKNGYEFLALSPSTYVGWNNDQAVLVISSYQKRSRYPYYPDMVAVDSVTIDSAIAPMEEKTEEITEAPVEKPKAAKPKTGTKKPVAKGNKNMKKTPVKKPAPKPKEIIDEEMVTTDEAPKMDYNDSLQEAKRNAWYLEQDRIIKEKQTGAAAKIINNSFSGSVESIENDISYKKVIDPAAHVTLWFNYENLLKQYWSSMFSSFRPYRYYDRAPAENTNKGDGFRSGMNIYFDKDKMRIEQRSFSPDEKMANLGKDLFNSKQSADMLKYVNPDNIGYLSMSINSEAMANYYYTLIKQYMANSPYISEYSDLVDVYVDLLEIIIDEKAIAELMPGNYLLVLHDMKTKQVTYTDYEYDADFKYKEVKKTKQELSPNFTFVMETKREGFMQKLANLPLKYAKKENFNYQEKGGYYELAFDEGKYPISSIYFMVKNGKVIITTSKASIDMTLTNTANSLDADTKNDILNNNYSLKISSKKLIQQINPELHTGTSKKVSTYLEENIGDLKMQSSLKNGMMQGTTTMSITGKHANSLEFFFNMIESINDIMEKDKQESEQKVN